MNSEHVLTFSTASSHHPTNLEDLTSQEHETQNNSYFTYNLIKAKFKRLYSRTSTTILNSNTTHILRHKVSLLVNVSAVNTRIHTFATNNLLLISFGGAGHRRGLPVIHLKQKEA
jgi:hypothetical protein